jgi:hypothetical protein
MPITLFNDTKTRMDPARLGAPAGIKLDSWQVDVMRSTDQQLVLNCHRQSGKSTTVALKALHTALYQRRALILLLSPSLRQSRELFRKVTDIYRARGSGNGSLAAPRHVLPLLESDPSRVGKRS